MLATKLLSSLFLVTCIPATAIQNDTLASYHFNVGENLVKNGELDSAFFHFKQAEIVLEKSPGLISEADIENKYGHIADLLQRHDEAREHFYASLRFCQLKSDSMGIADCHNNLAASFINEKNQDSVTFHMDRAENIYSRLGVQGKLSNLLNNRGVLLLNLGENELALDFFKNVLQLKTDIQDSLGQVATLINIGTTYLNLDNFDSSSVYLAAGLQRSFELNTIDYRPYAYLNLGHLHYNFEKYKEAADYYEAYHDLKDSLFSSQTESRIEELEVQYDVAQKDLTITETQLAKTKQRQLFLIIAGVLVLAVVVIAWILSARITRQKARTAAVLQVKDAENKRIANLLWKELGKAVQDKKLVLPGVELPEQTIQGAIEAAKFLTNQHFNPYLQVSLIHAVEYLISSLESTSGLTIKLNSEPLVLEKNERKSIYRVIENLLIDAATKQKEGEILVNLERNEKRVEIHIQSAAFSANKSMMYQTAEARVGQLKGKMNLHGDPGDEKLTVSIPV